MALTIGAILALLAIAVAVFPFVRHRLFGQPLAEGRSAPDVEDAGSVEYGPEELEEIYQAISTLQLERELGNIPEGLYREQLNSYRIAAARLLRGLDPARGGDWALEEEIRVARSGLGGREVPSRPCPNCGRPVSIHAGDCPECGVPMPTPFDTSLSPSDSSLSPRKEQEKS